MRVSLAWLAEWVDLPASPEELEERLTLGGIEIEDVLRSGPDLTPIRVGHVVERIQHPNADRLSVCRVDLGDGAEPVQIVCGAPNVAAGQRVAVATPGTVLPDGTKLKRSKIRGERSEGMICSARELGLGDDHDGILVLDPAATPGAPLDQVLRVGDRILDVEITPNRGDWASMLGIAREVRAHFPGPLRVPETRVTECGRPCADQISVAIAAPEACSRYVARVVRNVDPEAATPDWMKRHLEAAGLRSLGLVVDVTNFVLLEFGQPLHAFDLETLRGGCIRVRRAREGEKLVTLDGQARELSVEDLVIADSDRAIAIAGVMGGADTEVRSETRQVLIESAHFAAASVRTTARRLALHSEASYRFERGVDPTALERAADRAARLLAELGGGEVSPGRVEANGRPVERVEHVALVPERCNRMLGTQLSIAEMASLLERADFAVVESGEESIRCAVPSYRNDISIPVDLIEEVARLYGYDRLETTLPEGPVSRVVVPPARVLEEQVRDCLAACGLTELMHFPSASTEDLAHLRWPEDAVQRRPVRIANPLSQRDSELRTSLLPRLLRSAAYNRARQVDAVRVFELGAVFFAQGPGELPLEPLTLGIVLTRGELRGLWESAALPPLFFELKGIAERLIADLDMGLELQRTDALPYLHPGAGLELRWAGRLLGGVGELHPEAAKAFDLDVPCAVMELDLGPLIGNSPHPKPMLQVSPYPAVRRDIAVLLDRDQPAGVVLDAVRAVGGSNLSELEIFDRFEGSGIPAGKVSLAFRMIFQHAERTLTDKEVSKATDKVRVMLERRFGGELR